MRVTVIRPFDAESHRTVAAALDRVAAPVARVFDEPLDYEALAVYLRGEGDVVVRQEEHGAIATEDATADRARALVETVFRTGEPAADGDALAVPMRGADPESTGRADAVAIAVDQGENTMADTSDHDASALTLPVDFDIGSTTVSLADLDALRVGTVLALDLPRPDDGLAVTIRVGGTPVGTGDLVRIEDRLAVRITALWGAKA